MLQPGLINALLFATFNGVATLRTGSIRINRLHDGALLDTVVVHANQVNYIDLSPLALGDSPELFLFSSEDIAGIPIFFCRDADGRHMSLEHTHPPMELTVFGRPESRYRVINKMRTAWLEMMHRA